MPEQLQQLQQFEQTDLPIQDPMREALVCFFNREDANCQRLLADLNDARTCVVRLETDYELHKKSREATLQLICLHYPKEEAARRERKRLWEESRAQEDEQDWESMP